MGDSTQRVRSAWFLDRNRLLRPLAWFAPKLRKHRRPRNSGTRLAGLYDLFVNGQTKMQYANNRDGPIAKRRVPWQGLTLRSERLAGRRSLTTSWPALACCPYLTYLLPSHTL